MTTRREQIEAIALTMFENRNSSEFGRPDSFKDAAAINRDGWTFETSAPLGNTLRHAGVVLTQSELRAAWDRMIAMERTRA